MRTIIAVVIAVSTSIATAAWIQVGTGTGPAKVSVVEANGLGATVTVEIPGIQTESVAINGAQYLRLVIPGAVSAGLAVGKPEVPAVPVLLARPTGSTVTLRVLSIQTETLRVARVFPMQTPQKLGEQAGPLVVDSSFYASDVEYPSARLSRPYTATWRDLDVVNVHVYPVAVRPAQQEVVVASRMTFRVDFSGGHYPATVASWMQPMYRRLIQNYDRLGIDPASSSPPGTKCLVFCHHSYYNDSCQNPELVRLLDMMTMLGDSTEVISEPDDVKPDDIKGVIWERYSSQNGALRWVLLVGECDQIPPKENFSFAQYTIPWSDNWYADLNRNQGGTDSCDGYPEVGIARLSPSSVSNGDLDLSQQIQKIENYMMGTDTGRWLNKTTLVAHRTDAATEAVRGAASCTLHFYREGTRDTIMGYISPTCNDSITAHVERGTGVLIYLGHGAWNMWHDWDTLLNEDWTNAEVCSLDNTHAPVVFNLACGCCSLNMDRCLSEQWMSDSGRGAVASFGCTGSAWIGAANSQCTVAVRATGDYWRVPGHEEYEAPVFDLGGIQMLMDADIATKWPGDSTDSTRNASNIYSFMWLGNPAMQVWSGGIPESAVVSYPSQIPTGGPWPFHVSVKTSTGHPFENAQVCAYKPAPDGFYAVGLTNGNGDVWLSLTAEDTGSFYVSASKGHVLQSSPGQTHTPMLPYFGTSEVSGDTAFSTSEMTYPNWGRKLVRDPRTNTLHVVYTDKDSVFYTQSTDDGTTWPTVEPIGAGTSPAIVLNWGAPWVVYLASDSIMRAIRTPVSTWDRAVIFPGGGGASAGAPSVATDPAWGPTIATSFVTYPVHTTGSPPLNYVFFNTFTQYGVSQSEIVDSAGATSCYGASIVVTPGFPMHICWIRGQSVYYSQKESPDWTAPYQISSPMGQYITEPASNPSMEAYGDSVFCVWRGPNNDSVYPHDIWRRSRYLWNPASWWEDPRNQSQSESCESDFPVMTTSFATVWQEQVSPDSTEIWGRFLIGEPQRFFQESLPSRYPHVDGYWPDPNIMQFRCNTVWTQQTDSNPPQYALGSGWHDWVPRFGKGLGPDPREDYEPASYYAAELGQPRQSPYCLSRGGYAQFGSWNTDTSATGLTYQLPYLDPRRVYKLRAVLYHEGDSTWSADLRCDSGPWHRVKVAPNVPDTFWLQVPKVLYKNDARIVVEVARMTGGYVSLARLKLFQIEELPGDDRGVQSWGTGMTYVTRLRGCAPNPFARGTSVNYELAQYGTVELTVHDVSGRLVRRLESGPRQSGFQTARWDGNDGRGRVVPAGVYFVRFSAGGKVSTGRVTLIR